MAWHSRSEIVQLLIDVELRPVNNVDVVDFVSLQVVNKLCFLYCVYCFDNVWGLKVNIYAVYLFYYVEYTYVYNRLPEMMFE